MRRCWRAGRAGGGAAGVAMSKMWWERFSQSLSLYMANSTSYIAACSARVLQALSEAGFRPARCLLATASPCTSWTLRKKMYIAVIIVAAAASEG